MPELPEVETIRRELVDIILNRRIVHVEVRLPKIVSVGPQVVSNVRRSSKKQTEQFRRLLIGQRIKAVRRRAKMLIFDLAGPMTLIVHLKMTGQLIFARKNERKRVKIFNAPNSRVEELPHKHTHVIFTFSDGSKLFFNDLRQFGYLRLVRDREINKVKELAEYGLEPLSRDFTAAYLRQKAEKRAKLSVKQFLMEPRVVAGIGNIYSDEILFCAKIRPDRLVRSLSPADFQAIYRCIPQILKRALKAHGSSVGDFFQVDGSEGRFGRKHMVYQRFGQPCKVCGKVIEKIKLGGRTSSYCQRCQK